MRGLLSIPIVLASVASLQAQAPNPQARIFGYIHARFQAAGDSAAFSIRRARLGALGALHSWATFRVVVELRTGGDTAGATVAMKDAVAIFTTATARWSAAVGQFKVPFSREELQSAGVVELAERALVVDALAPGRDVGAMGEWRPGGSASLVQVGVFNGEGENRATNPDGRMLWVARAVVGKGDTRGGLAFGGGVASDPAGTRWGLEGEWRRGAWVARAEVIALEPASGGSRDHGWYVLGARKVARDKAQIVGRVEALTAGAPAATVNAYTLGGQYFLRGEDLKVQAGYTVFDVSGGASVENRLILQLQVRF
jgi:phosphate-selective porin OprO and OprP